MGLKVILMCDTKKGLPMEIYSGNPELNFFQNFNICVKDVKMEACVAMTCGYEAVKCDGL